MKPLRWGFLSTAGIARKNWVAIHQTENCVVTAVASRELGRAQAFINECQAVTPFARPPQALGSYEALLASPEVDAVYIPLPTGVRADWVMRAAKAGKQVLCEKPCATSTAELEKMLAACREQGVQFMDGVMFMHSPRLPAIRTALDDGVSIGEIRRIMSIFSFLAYPDFGQKNIRASGELEPAGCLGDLGWYCLRFALWAMKWQMPREVIGRTLSAGPDRPGAASGPLEFSGELFFAEGVSAGFYCSFTAPNQRWVNVSGAKGSLRMDDFVHPFNAQALAYQHNDALVPVPVSATTDPSGRVLVQTQEVNMFRTFANQVHSGRLNEEWPQWSWRTQRVQDACLEAARLGGRPVTVAG
jgi:predicted dehydrogenase